MENIIKLIITYLASIIAFILMVIGIRQIKLKEHKKYGFFITSIIISLSLSGCNIEKQINNKSETSNQQNNEINRLTDSKNIHELNDYQEWQDFKKLWKKIDKITPKDDSDNYLFSLPLLEKEKYEKELKESITKLKELEKNKIISNEEIELLQMICQERLEYMTSHYMLSRMMLPVTASKKNNEIKNLEKQIDILLELKNNKKISKIEFDNALTIIKKEIHSISFLDILNEFVKNYYFLNTESEDNIYTVEDAIKELDAYFLNYNDLKNESNLDDEDYFEGIEKKYTEAKKKINEIDKIFPSLDIIIEDLER